MNFADHLRNALAVPQGSKSLRPLAMKCAVAVGAVCLLPLFAGSVGGAVRAAVALGLLCTLALLVLRRMGRVPSASRSDALTVVARATLSSKNALAVVQVNGRRIVIAYGEGFTEVLSSEPIDVPRTTGGDQ